METVRVPGFGEVDGEAFVRLLRGAGVAESDTASDTAAMLVAEEALLAEAAVMVHPGWDEGLVDETLSDESLSDFALTAALEAALADAELKTGPLGAAPAMVEEAIDAVLARAVSTAADAAAAMAAHVTAVDDTLTLACRDPEVFVGPRWRTVRDAVEFARRSAVCELATRLGISENTVNAYAMLAHTLRSRLPLTWAAFGQGRVSFVKAGIIADQVQALAGLVSETAMAELDEALLAAAGRLTPAKLRQKARGLRERLHPEPAVDRHAMAMRERRVCVNAEPDGMAWLNALLPAEVAQGAWARLDAAARNLATLPGEERTLDQLRADAAGDILTAAGTANAVCAVVNVTVPVMTLVNPEGQQVSGAPLLNLTPAGAAPRVDPASLEGYGPIDEDTARRLTGGASTLYRILVDPIDGATITVDRKKYRPPADLKRLVKTRFATCSFPGCNRPAERCDLDHTEAFNSGGDTDAENLAPLCRHHHGVKHKTGWTMKRTPDTSIQWVSPRGDIHDTDPPPF
jgi:hypothetical protein